MNKNSDASINDIVERLRKKMENEASVGENVIEKSKQQSDEQLLKNLREHIGEGVTTAPETKENEYDISGFEISEDEFTEAPADENLSQETEPFEDGSEVVREPIEPKEDKPKDFEACGKEEDDALPWDEDDGVSVSENEPEIDMTVMCEPLSESHEESSLVSEEIQSDISSQEELCEEDDSPVEMTAENEEAVRKQVELFVEKTLEPEEEFDYFAQIDQRRAKGSSSNETSREVESEQDDNIDPVTPEQEDIIAESESAPESSQSPIADNVISSHKNEDLPIVVSVQKEEIPSEDSSDDEDSTMDEELVNSFFFSKKLMQKSNDAEVLSADAESTDGLDDTDINLLLALGKKRDLEDTIGFVRVREAKNNFYDPTEEEPIRRNIFAYSGQEYRSFDETDKIKAAYRKEKKKTYRRLVLSILFVAVFLVMEHFSLLNMEIPGLTELFANGLYYYTALLVLFLLNILISGRHLLNGLRGFFTMRPTRYTPISVLAVIQLLYSTGVLLFFREESPKTYLFVFSVFMLFAIIGDNLRLTKETLTFDIISDPHEKFSLEKSEETAEISREKKVLRKKDLLVERVHFVGKYFSRTSHRPIAYTEYFYEFLAILLVAVFSAVLAAANSGDLATVLATFIFSVMLGLPIQHLLCIYPYTRLSKKLYRHQSAVIGETADEEYVGANTVYLDDIEMFGRNGVSISGLRIYNNADFYNVLYHAMAVFSPIEGPLRYVLENSSHEIQAAKSVELINIYANGIEAIVDDKNKVFIGNINFMRSNGFFPKRNEEDDKKVEEGELSILYMVIGSSLCAKFYMKYTVAEHFEKFVSEMEKNKTKVGIRTLDPNVTEKMIAALRPDKDTEISVIRPTLNDLIPLGKRSDSGIITAKGPHMISKILADCLCLKKVHRVYMALRFASILVSLITTLILVLTNSIGYAAPIMLAIYHLLWTIPMIIYTKIKIK